MGAPRACEHDPVGCDPCRYTRKLASSIAWKLANAAKNKAITDKWFEDNQEYRQEYTKEYYLLNAEHLKAYTKQWIAANEDRHWMTKRGYVFPLGMTKKTWRAAQTEICKMCFKPAEPGNPLVIDHDHGKPGVPNVRDLLHRTCNSMAGMVHEDPTHFRQGAAYLERHNGVLANDLWDWSSAFHPVLQ